MAISKKLETIYHNGQPDGIRSIRRNLSTMTTYVIPRPLLSEAKSISGITRPGIYYLINESDDNEIVQIYIGQTRNGIIRLNDHNRSKNFWNKAIIFLAESKTFTLDMISGLEKFAILKARKSKRYKVENNIIPKYEIDEYDLASVKEIYDEIQFIMATQGYKMEDIKTTKTDILHTTQNGIIAFGVYDGEKFEVIKGSQVNIDKPVSPEYPKYNRQRERLLAQQCIVKRDDGKYILNVTLNFNTPSGASTFVLGGSTNGWLEWKTNDGKTLDEFFRKKLE